MKKNQAGVPCLRMILEIRDRNNFADTDFFGAAIRLNGVGIDDAVLVVKSVASPRLEDVQFALDIELGGSRVTPKNLIFQNLDNALREVLGKRKKFRTTRARLQNMIGSLDGVIGFDPFGESDEGKKVDLKGDEAEENEGGSGSNTNKKNKKNKKRSDRDKNLEMIKQRRDAAVRKFDEKIVEERLKAKAKEIEVTGNDNLLDEEVPDHSVEPEAENGRKMLIAHLNNWMGYQEKNKEEIFENLQKKLQKTAESQQSETKIKTPVAARDVKSKEKLRQMENKEMEKIAGQKGFLALKANSAHMKHSREQILKLGQPGLSSRERRDGIIVDPRTGKLHAVKAQTPDAILNREAEHTPHVLAIPIRSPLIAQAVPTLGHGNLAMSHANPALVQALPALSHANPALVQALPAISQAVPVMARGFPASGQAVPVMGQSRFVPRTLPSEGKFNPYLVGGHM